jgi:hypothetical protein
VVLVADVAGAEAAATAAAAAGAGVDQVIGQSLTPSQVQPRARAPRRERRSSSCEGNT